MDHKATEVTTFTDLKNSTTHGAEVLGEKAGLEVSKMKESLTPTQYKDIFKTTAECAAMVMFPVLGIAWAGEQAYEKITKHK